MLRFSQRHGLTPIKNKIQSTTMDDDFSNGLWNALTEVYWEPI